MRDAAVRRARRRALKSSYLAVRRRIRDEVTTQCGPHRLTYSSRDEFIGTDLFLRGAWEPHLTRILPHLSLDGRIAIDVGANIGTYTVRLSDAVGPRGAVIAIEPDEQNAGWLERNVRQNGCRNVTVRRVALGATAGAAAFVHDRKNLGNHRVVDGRSMHDSTVQMETLDSIVAELPVGAVGYVKIDVQGFELGVLQGATSVLAEHRSAVVQIELNADRDGGAAAVVELLRDHGWDGFEVHAGRLIPMLPTRGYEWPWFRSECDLLLSTDPADLAARLANALG